MVDMEQNRETTAEWAAEEKKKQKKKNEKWLQTTNRLNFIIKIFT